MDTEATLLLAFYNIRQGRFSPPHTSHFRDFIEMIKHGHTDGTTVTKMLKLPVWPLKRTRLSSPYLPIVLLRFVHGLFRHLVQM